MMRTHALRIGVRIPHPHARPECDAPMHVRTDERYGQTYRSPWDPSLRLSDARSRVNPEIDMDAVKLMADGVPRADLCRLMWAAGRDGSLVDANAVSGDA